jgi:asparagine synthase (glutamine-hydrolysing)
MCGIAGFTLPHGVPVGLRRERFERRLRRMTASLRHRGPDALAAVLLDGVALGHARLAILDRDGGAQPMRDAASGVTLVYNGEVFNYLELRDELAAHPFRTRSDTEVVLAAYLHWGISCLERFNGQFALAIHDPRDRTLWLARDRFGILPLHYVASPDGLAFASEAKALLAGGHAEPRLDPRGVKQALQLWSPVPPRTCIEGIRALAPGALARFHDGRLELRRWWALDLGADPEPLAEAEAVDRAGALLEDAVRLRLRADVPVAAYLSGGLDSSALCAIAQRQLGGTLSTFSVAFPDPAFDESRFQRAVSAALGTRHRAIVADEALVGELLPEVVRHAEQVLVRAAPAPLLALSRLVRDSGGKVVLTGEGSDEIFLGYDLYAETRVRLFWARRPGSRARPALLRRLYPYLPLGAQGEAALRHFYGLGLDDPAAPAFSHLVRWAAAGRLFRLFSPEFAAAVADEDPVQTLLAGLPPEVARWRPLARAQLLEMTTLLAGNLLSAQGDRMLMASSVEGRFPFLDHRLVELAARLPDRLKLRGVRGKWLLRRWARSRVPDEVLERPKIPYRSPPARVLAGPAAPAWARELLTPAAVRQVGVFDPDKVGRLMAKLGTPSQPASEVDAMGITAVATGQLLARALRDLVVDGRAVDGCRVEAA